MSCGAGFLRWNKSKCRTIVSLTSLKRQRKPIQKKTLTTFSHISSLLSLFLVLCFIFSAVKEKPWILELRNFRNPDCYGLYCITLKCVCWNSNPILQNVTLFGDWALKEVIMVKWSHLSVPETHMTALLIRD